MLAASCLLSLSCGCYADSAGRLVDRIAGTHGVVAPLSPPQSRQTMGRTSAERFLSSPPPTTLHPPPPYLHSPLPSLPPSLPSSNSTSRMHAHVQPVIHLRSLVRRAFHSRHHTPHTIHHSPPYITPQPTHPLTLR
ncbi:unnamed protein product [Taenia asiatica]|uniref:Secreted protein n=1 Tax=Taenia asiatica TaxID=60517 RepID=A0A3P6PV25_TAEAS|nr:unnamed protein product [Taenia asiatica]